MKLLSRVASQFGVDSRRVPPNPQPPTPNPQLLRRWWKRLPAWVRALLAMAGFAGLFKVTVQIFIQISPRITPPAVGFVLDSRARQFLRSVSGTLRPLQLRNGLRVLEVGGGTGAFTVPLAERVAPDGEVYSVELQRGMLVQQERRVRGSEAANIWLHQANALHLPFADSTFDRAVLIALLPMLPDKQHALRELRRVLKPGGLLAISEELLEPEYVPLRVTRRWGTQAGFEEVEAYREPWFYTLVFRNKAGPEAEAPGPGRTTTEMG